MPVKFILIFKGGEEVRTLKDLREKFSIEDVLEIYYSGKLIKWLEVRGYETELKAVKAIKTENTREVLAELLRIFNVEDTQEKIHDDLEIFDYVQGRRSFWKYIFDNGLDEIEDLRRQVSNLKSENASLKQENLSLTRKTENLRSAGEKLKIEINKPQKIELVILGVLGTVLLWILWTKGLI